MKHRLLYIIILLLGLSQISCQHQNNASDSLTQDTRTSKHEIYVQDYLPSDTIDDLMPYLRMALDDCKSKQYASLILPEGRYQVKGDYAYERYCFVSNNDEGLKRIAFDLTDFQNIDIVGQNTRLDFVGYIVPFLISKASHITVSGISVDYTTPFHSEALVTNVTDHYFDVRFDPNEFPYNIQNGCLYFNNKPTGSESFNLLLEFDSRLKEPAYKACDNWVDGTERCEELDNGDVRIFREGMHASVGNVMVFGCNHRLVPGFIISDSKDVTIHDVNVYHTGGMAFIAQRSQDIELNHVIVTPAPDRHRIVSATADATHFSNCSGTIRLIDCLFENQKDDATNIHGIYAMIEKIESPNTIIVKYVHEAQHGFNYLQKDMNVEVVDNASLVTTCHRQVQACEVLNDQLTRVTFTEALPEEVKERFVIAQVDEYPEVLIQGCTFRSNRARGLLIGSRGKVVIADNLFHIPGAAILFEGDGSYWYEQSGVRDVEICGNTFQDCNYGCHGWGNACIAVGTGLWEHRDSSRYHHDIRIHDNIFNYCNPRILSLYCVDGLDFRNNTLNYSDQYIFDTTGVEMFKYQDCDGITIDR